MKKIICLALSFVLALSLSMTAWAAEYLDTANGTIYKDNNVRYFQRGELMDTSRTLKEDSLSNSSVEYSYNFDVRTENPAKADVVLVFNWLVNGEIFSASVEGTVDAYNLEDGRIFWEGILRGNIPWKQQTAKVLCGFSKIDGSSEIQANITIQGDSIDPIMFSFGAQVLTMDMHEKLAGKSEASRSGNVGIDTLSEESNASVVWVTSGYAGFEDDEFLANAITSRLFFDRDNNRCAVAVQSNCAIVETKYPASDVSSASIKTISYGLTRGASAAGATYSYIAGVETFGFTMPSQGSSIRGALSPLFEDAMSLIGIPTSTINAIVGNLYGTVEMNTYTNNYTVSFEFGLYDEANFDDSGRGVPVVFQIQPGPSYAGGGSPYTVTITMEYRLMVIGGPDGLVGNFYYAANDCIYNATLPVME